MKLLTCPINGPRPLQEFEFGGEVRDMPDPATASDEQWADYVFCRRGEPAVKREWWYHAPSGTWFIAERDNRTDEVLRTCLYDAIASAPQAQAPKT
jgi:sarcosine oxidase subunit delta